MKYNPDRTAIAFKYNFMVWPTAGLLGATNSLYSKVSNRIMWSSAFRNSVDRIIFATRQVVRKEAGIESP